MSKSISFAKATISKEDNTITEITKDGEKIYSLSDLINDWDGITGISITFKKDDELESIEDKVNNGEDE